MGHIDYLMSNMSTKWI